MSRPAHQRMRRLSPRVEEALWAKARLDDSVGTPWGEAEDWGSIERDIHLVVAGRLGTDGSDVKGPL